MTVTAGGRAILAHTQTLEPLGGVEICTLQDSLALAARGHRISVLFGAEGSMRPTYEAAGVGLRGPYPFAFAPRRAVHDLRSFLPAARAARATRPDVVWLNRIEHLIWGQVVSRWARCPLVCHLHGPPVYNRMAAVGRGVAHFVAVSEFIRQRYLERGIAPDRITRVYNALPPGGYPMGGLAERAAARDQLGIPAEAPVVLCYGQLSTAKGLSTLIEAWRAVSTARPDARLVLVDATSGRPEQAIIDDLDRLEPSSSQRFPVTGDVVPFLHAADVVAFPSWLPEAFGRVVLEGMATGRPVVASRVGGVPEILSGEMARFLVEPRSADALAASLLSVLDWREREPGLQFACAAWVEEHFPYSAHLTELENILQQHARS